MAANDQDPPDHDQPDQKPQTLASLWLKSKPSRPTPPHPPEARGNQIQLGLLFSTPAATSTTAPPNKPLAPVKVPPPPITAPTQTGRHVWTVRALVTNIRQHVETTHADIWVEGEISNCRPASSGHIYFTLKDGEAQLSVVLFRMQAQLLCFRPQDGLAVLARGRISVYESRGQLQLIADTLEPRGAGALQLAYEQLKARLLAEGLFDAARKRPLPAFPRTLGVITSTSGAVLHDIIKVVRRRHARLNLLVYPALMQGPDCAATVANGIRYFNQHPGNVDLILIARGGGSLEDLAGFNSESLARAIAESTLPTVSAIGHETDFTIADFVADLRAPTPSAAAELITSAQHRIEEHIAALQSRAHRAIRYQLILARQHFNAHSIPQMQNRIQSVIGRRGQRLDDLRDSLEAAATRHLRISTAHLATLATRLEPHNPTTRLALARRRIESASDGLRRTALTTISTRATRLDHATARLEALSPLAVLNRGYALVYTANGTLLRNAADAKPGDPITARLTIGTLQAEVVGSKPVR